MSYLGIDYNWTAIAVTTTVLGIGTLYVSSLLFFQRKMHTFVPQTKEELSIYEKGNHTVVDRMGERKPILSEKGWGSSKPLTVTELLNKAAQNHPDDDALRVERQEDMEWKWKVWSWKQYQEDTMKAARAFIKLGLKDKDAVSTIGFNSPEWLISHMGCIAAGGLSAGIYTTNDSESCAYIVNHSKSVVVVAEDQTQLDKFLNVISEIPTVKAIVVYSGIIATGSQKKAGDVKLFTWDEFMEIGSQDEQPVLDERIASSSPGKPCTLIYTSGTTGNPKAVMLSHDNASWTSGCIYSLLDTWGDSNERIVSYLPLSHIAAQLEDIFFPIFTTANCKSSASVWFARPDALKGSLKDTLAQARPTFFFGVPRVWEKFMEAMKAKGASGSALKKRIASWAKATGFANFTAFQAGGSGHIPFLYPLFKWIVFDNIKKALGLDQCKAVLTGAAPISEDVLNYFGSLDIHILNLYGMSESTGPVSTCVPNFFKVGTVGSILPGIEAKIVHEAVRDKPGEGEICYRGRNIMLGYMDDPEKTAETIDENGFLHSGDVGKIENGLLSITGRIKELIITAGGENIAPVPIEDKIKSELPAISNIMMVGDRRKYNSCLITLKTEVDSENRPTANLTVEALDVSAAKTVSEAKEDDVWKKYIESGIKRYNSTAVSRAQKIQKFTILETDFSVAGGELTATLKLKRSVVAKMYENEIESMYA